MVAACCVPVQVYVQMLALTYLKLRELLGCGLHTQNGLASHVCYPLLLHILCLVWQMLQMNCCDTQYL